MFSKEEKDFITGIYRCKDDIKNLKLRVRVECIKSSAIPHEVDIPSASGRGILGGTASSAGGQTDSNCLAEVEISWQQRILSADEYTRYVNSGNCYTKQQQQWNQEIQTGQQKPNQRIFTYTQQDEVLPEHEREILVHNGDKHPTRLESNLRTVRKVLLEKPSRTPVILASSAGGPRLSGGSIVDDCPCPETKLLNRTLSSPIQLMYVFVQLCSDLSSDDDLTNQPVGVSPPLPQSVNYHLLTLTWDDTRRVLSITPDLCTSASLGDSYKIDTSRVSDPKAARTEYRYAVTLGGDSTSLRADTLEREREILTEQLLWKKPSPISLEGSFLGPRQGVHDVFVTGEIVTAQGFEYNHLFVQYCVHLPEGWSCDEPHKLYGVTQKCRFANKSRVAKFSFPFEFKLSLNLSCLEETEHSDAQGHPYSPQLLFEIGSLDSWGRYRNEGYAWAPLPRTPGRAHLRLTSVRPAPRSPIDELCRAFIGSSLQISDLTYVGTPAQSATLVSKYGFSTLPSGELTVTLNIAHQSHVTNQRSALEPGAKSQHISSSVYLLERLSANTLLSNINNVIEAFQRARQRILLVRQPLMSPSTPSQHPAE
uniref:Meckel syndrome type 1 protein n=1 Tax=Cacopsylla melanoneura TaxID=428564 RepID=A0A8D8TXC6_9HEMI